jgi:serine/threonine protein kinase
MADHLDRIGQQVGDYRLLRWLGGGSFGNVYLAEHLHEPRQVAVKLLDIQLNRSDDLKAFLNEARTMRLRHPYIVPLLDFGLSEQDLPFLVMEYEPLGSIRDRYPRGTNLPLSTVLLYTPQIASALAYAHEQRLVHRDVKPENMLVRDDRTILLSDFGVASVAHSSHSLSLYQGFGGTVPYAAPEQMQGKPRPASDQYGLAVVVYEWLAGRRPFEGTAVEVAMQHMMTPPPSLLRQVPTLPPGIEQVLFTALAKDPKERFSSVWDFAQALQEAFRQSRPIPSIATIPAVQVPPSALPALPSSPGQNPPFQPASLPVNGGIEPAQASRSLPPFSIQSLRQRGISQTTPRSPYRQVGRDIVAVGLSYVLAFLLVLLLRNASFLIPYVMGVFAAAVSGRKGFNALLPIFIGSMVGFTFLLGLRSSTIIGVLLALLGAMTSIVFQKIRMRASRKKGE